MDKKLTQKSQFDPIYHEIRCENFSKGGIPWNEGKNPHIWLEPEELDWFEYICSQNQIVNTEECMDVEISVYEGNTL